MLEVYSQNISVGAGSQIPVNSVTVEKGCTAVINGATSIQLNRCGVYMVSMDASAATSATSGNIVIQMNKNGVAQSQAIAINTSSSTTDVESLSFVTIVQVNESNSCRCCDTPTTITFTNAGVSANYAQFNVVVTKIC